MKPKPQPSKEEIICRKIGLLFKGSENGKIRCLMCGKLTKRITKHHAIPRRLKPKFNISVPVCRDCHLRIHNSIKCYDDNQQRQNTHVEDKNILHTISNMRLNGTDKLLLRNKICKLIGVKR